MQQNTVLSAPDSKDTKDSFQFLTPDQRTQPSSIIVADRPADDGYNWRKYGQKQFKGWEFPRSYYRCTNPSCHVRKRVERSLDGQVFEIIYSGQHNHQLPRKCSKDGANPDGNTESQGHTVLSSQSQRGNVNSISEEIGCSNSTRDPESCVTGDKMSSDEPDVGDEGPKECEVDEDELDQRTQPSFIIVDKPADDGYNWRKYGQKQVKGSEFPRSYYKCTHPSCHVKKKVEHSLNGQVIEIIYRGQHNHQLPRKCSKDGANPDGDTEGQGHTVLSSQSQGGNLNSMSEGTGCSISKRDQESSQVSKEEIKECEVDHDELDQRTQPSLIIFDKPADDGYNWRKYGQKQMKESEFPRSYYKCTHSSCLAKKKVECSLDGQVTVIYKGQHNHQRPQKRSEDGGNPNGNMRIQGHTELSLQSQSGNLNSMSEGLRYSICKRDQESIQARIGDIQYLRETLVDKPADAGYNWRKYGQKQGKGSEFPKHYYKCAYLRCPVKKKVTRSLDGQVTLIYKGQHNHQPPQKRSNNGANPDGNMRSQENTGLSSQSQGGNLYSMIEGMGYSISKRNQESSRSAGDQMSSDEGKVVDEGTKECEGNEDEPDSTRRNTEVRMTEQTTSHRTITEPRIIVQITSEVDVLDDGYRWRSYGQRVVRVHPYSRSVADGVKTRRFQLIPQVFSVSDPTEFESWVRYYSSGEVRETFVGSTETAINIALLYFSLFPEDFEFDKAMMIQLWVAGDIINKEPLESIAGWYFERLLDSDFILFSRWDLVTENMLYKWNSNHILSLASGCGHIIKDSNLNTTDVGNEISHLAVKFSNQIDSPTPDGFKRFKKLKTLLYLEGHKSSFKQIPRDFFLSLEQLQVLDLSRTHVAEIPNTIAYMRCLRYLDLSQTPISRLPEAIDNLSNLQTLRLKGCSKLFMLPKGITKLTNLRHLDLDILHQLRSMPKGMGTLTKLQTLSAFLVGIEKACSIAQLRNMNKLTGSFCISRLENVSTKEAIEACLSAKSQLTKLELRWSDSRDDDDLEDDEVLSSLQPNARLEELRIVCYRGFEMPSWICDPVFSRLVTITIFKCENCQVLPSLGQLPSLKVLNLIEFHTLKVIDHTFRGNGFRGYMVPFPKLEKLTIESMYNLVEWTGIEELDFPCLLKITVKNCPQLHSLCTLSCLPSLISLEISCCTVLAYFADELLPASVETLIIEDCPLLSSRIVSNGGEGCAKVALIQNVWVDHQKIIAFDKTSLLGHKDGLL